MTTYEYEYSKDEIATAIENMCNRCLTAADMWILEYLGVDFNCWHNTYF